MTFKMTKSKYYGKRLILPLIITLCTFTFVILTTYIRYKFKIWLPLEDDDLYQNLIKYISLFFCSVSLFLIADANKKLKKEGKMNEASLHDATILLANISFYISGFCLLEFYLDNIQTFSNMKFSIRCLYTSSFIITVVLKNVLNHILLISFGFIVLICFYIIFTYFILKNKQRFIYFKKEIKKNLYYYIDNLKIKLSLGFRYSSVP